MKIWIFYFVSIVLCGCATTAPAPRGESFLVTFPLTGVTDSATAGPTGTYYREDQWRAPLRTRQLARRLAKMHDLRLIDAWPINALNLHCVLFDATPDTDLAQLFKTIQRHDFVADVQPNFEFEAMISDIEPAYNDPLFMLQYGKNVASIRRLHNITLGESSVVGLIDSVVDLQHPDLTGQVAKQHPLVGSNDTQDQLHGTAMAGIIAALVDNGEGVVGIAPEAKMYVYGACTSNAQRAVCRSFDIARAIAHAIADGVNVLNMSFAGPDDRLLTQLLTMAATEHDMTIVAANNAENPERNFPAKMEFVHAAADTDSLWFARLAQMSTQAGGGYQLFYGSSVASAGIAGVAALLRSAATPQATNAILKDLVELGCGTTLPQRVNEEFVLSVLCE